MSAFVSMESPSQRRFHRFDAVHPKHVVFNDRFTPGPTVHSPQEQVRHNAALPETKRCAGHCGGIDHEATFSSTPKQFMSCPLPRALKSQKGSQVTGQVTLASRTEASSFHL